MKQRYVLGFVISGDKILLQRKNRGPDFMIDKLNGVGGKVNPYEDVPDAMDREYYEETGDNRQIPFEYFMELVYDNCLLYLYKATVSDDFYDNVSLKAMNDDNPEELEFHDINKLPFTDMVYNLKYIIPLMLDLDIE